ncbi:hypothetical protein K439DRAFT_865515 [Ramaria rubella]|nr:hypothetical protein K439DRAFT_865515 [Ramaria rubella]
MSAITDSDIQFLGNWNSQQPTSTPSIVSGTSPLDLTRTFCRSQTSVVHVGRTPALDASVPVDDRVTFLNPVMSRNHAKITFADSGSVFIIDTNSHHGTCISRSLGQFKLASESPFQLQDGDKITFGKDVLRNGLLHKPLTVSVKLLRTTSTPSSMSISSTSVSPIGKTSSPRSRNRFGLSPASDSEDSSDSPANQNGNENDLLPCTGSNAIVLDISESDTSSFPTSSDDSSLVSPSGLELEGINMLADVASPSSSSTPPWRRLAAPSQYWSSPYSFLDPRDRERVREPR